MTEAFDLIHELSTRQSKLIENLNNAGLDMYFLRRSVYELYNELRKYDKTLPPWGSEIPPDPKDSDKWIENDSKI